MAEDKFKQTELNDEQLDEVSGGAPNGKNSKSGLLHKDGKGVNHGQNGGWLMSFD